MRLWEEFVRMSRISYKINSINIYYIILLNESVRSKMNRICIKCPYDWEPHRHACYSSVLEATQWKNSQNQCNHSMNANLMVIKSIDAIKEFLIQKISGYSLWVWNYDKKFKIFLSWKLPFRRSRLVQDCQIIISSGQMAIMSARNIGVMVCF